MRNKLIAHALIKISGKYLIIKRVAIKRGKTNAFPKYWDIPGGSVEAGELSRDATVREVAEEVNIRVKLKNVIHEDSNLDEGKQIVFTRLVYVSPNDLIVPYLKELIPDKIMSHKFF